MRTENEKAPRIRNQLSLPPCHVSFINHEHGLTLGPKYFYSRNILLNVDDLMGSKKNQEDAGPSIKDFQILLILTLPLVSQAPKSQ